MARKIVEETGCSTKACHPVSQVSTAHKVETNTSTPVQSIHMGASFYSLYHCLGFFPRCVAVMFVRKRLLWFTVEEYSVLWWES